MTAHRAARLIRAAASAILLAALIAGLPAALYKFGASPLPHHLPSWHQVTAALARRDDGTLFIAAVRDVSWAAWAAFTLSALTEAGARARGRPAPRLPALGPLQALAAALITASMTAAQVPPALPAVTPALLASRTAVTAPPFPGPAAAGAAAATPGIRLDAARTASPSGQAGPEDRVHTVVAGDNLWDLARTYLGSGERWHEIYHLNRGRPQPGGATLTHPARIYPGWELLIPAAGPHPQHGRGHPPGGHPARHRRTPPPAATGSPSPARSPHPARSTPATGRPGAHHHAGPPGVRLPSGALIGLGTAVAVSAAVALARIHRRRRYRPGTVLTSSLEPSMPPPPVIAALDRAARTPARTPPADGTGPDDTEPDLDLDLYEPYELYEQPFPGPREPGRAAAPAPGRPASAQPPGQQGTVPAPPGPVPIGIRDGQEITADPAALGGLGLTGPGAPAAARAILAGLLARPPRRQDGTPAEIIIPAADAARLLPGPPGQRAHPPIRGVSVPRSLDTALDEAEAMIVRLARTADGDDGPQTVAVVLAAPGPAAAQRLAGITAAGRDLGITVILLGDWPHGTTCHITSDGLISGVTPPQADLAGTEAYHLEAADLAAIIAQLDQAREPSGDDGPAAPSPPETGQPHLLSAPAAPGPAQAGAPRRPPQHPPPAGTARQGTGPGPAGTPVQISVLGPLQITAAGREIGAGLRKARELLAFLAVHPDGASGEAISEALWPESDPGRAAGQRNLALRKAREMLRTASALPAPLWILNASGRYRLDPALIGTDLEAFSEALEEARNASGDARLAACRRAVALYRGELADGTGYEWAEPYAEAARRRALDAWTTIAEILQPRDPDQALSALETALAHDPYNEYLYVRIMRLQAAAGRPEAVRRTLALLESRLTELGITPGAPTRQAAAALLAAAAPGHVGSADR